MTDIYMPEPNMQLVRDVRERREDRTQTSDGPLLDELADALESSMSRLREAEKVIADALAETDGFDIPVPEPLVRARRTLIDYETTKTENGSES